MAHGISLRRNAGRAEVDRPEPAEGQRRQAGNGGHESSDVLHSDDTPAWNELEISARGTRVRAVLNGVVVRDWDGAGVLDDATHRERNVGLRGHLALQIHKGDRLKMRFKDVSLRELGDSTSASSSTLPAAASSVE